MPQVEIQIKNIGALRQAFRDFPKISEPILQRAIMGTVAVFAKYTTRSTVPFRTGRLLQSFIPEFGRLQSRWSPTVKYAIFVHEGTRPHLILPVNKKALYWQGADHPVRKVRHPGTQPRPFMRDIAERSSPEINKLFLQALDLINRDIANRVNSEA